MLPNGRALLIVSFVGFASNWQFGYQITYINTASSVFYKFASEYYHEEKSANYPDYSKNMTGNSMPYTEWSNKWSFVVSSFYPGTFVGFVLVPQLIRRVGVRRSLLLSTYPAVIGCLLQLFSRIFAQMSVMTFVYAMAGGRFLVGIQAGCSLCLLPLFVIESSPVENRPFLSSLQQVFQALSTLLGLVLGSIPLNSNQIEWFQMIAILPMCFFITLLIFLPDTPLYLLEGCGARDFITADDAFRDNNLHFKREFYKSVLFYHGNSANISTIREEAFDRWNVEMSEGDKGLKSFENIKGMLIGSMAAISFSFTADDVIDSYSSQLFYRIDNSNVSEMNPTIGYGMVTYAQVITMLLGFWLLIASVFGAFLIDRFGRKKLIILGLIGTSLSNLFAAIGANYSSVVLMTIGFAFTKGFIGFGAGGPAWFLTSELVSSKATCTAQSISTGSLLLMTGVVTLLFLPAEIGLGATWSLLLLSSLPALLIAVFLIVFLPETKDRSYEEIREQLRDHFFSGLSGGKMSTSRDWCQFVGNNFNPLVGNRARDGSCMETWNGSRVASPTGTRTSGAPKYQRLMSASSYASYGSLRSHGYGNKDGHNSIYSRQHSQQKEANQM